MTKVKFGELEVGAEFQIEVAGTQCWHKIKEEIDKFGWTNAELKDHNFSTLPAYAYFKPDDVVEVVDG